jgi:hypothetical protein
MLAQVPRGSGSQTDPVSPGLLGFIHCIVRAMKHGFQNIPGSILAYADAGHFLMLQTYTTEYLLSTSMNPVLLQLTVSI